jgi:hypothetical protein
MRSTPLVKVILFSPLLLKRQIKHAKPFKLRLIFMDEMVASDKPSSLLGLGRKILKKYL